MRTLEIRTEGTFTISSFGFGGGLLAIECTATTRGVVLDSSKELCRPKRKKSRKNVPYLDASDLT